jgi:hypothetical protein
MDSHITAQNKVELTETPEGFHEITSLESGHGSDLILNHPAVVDRLRIHLKPVCGKPALILELLLQNDRLLDLACSNQARVAIALSGFTF